MAVGEIITLAFSEGVSTTAATPTPIGVLSGNSLTNAKILVGNASNIAAEITPSGDATITNAGVITIANSAVTNAKVSASAAIDFSKLATLSSGNILVGNGSNVATSVAVTGDVTISNAGVTAIGTGKVTSSMILDGTIVNADINASAAIAGSKLQAASNTNSGTLSYYLESTFTPTYTTSGTNYGSVTYSTQYGKYTRIGNVVTFTLRVDVSSVTVGSATGALAIGGLPHNSAASQSTIVHVKSNSVDYNGTSAGVFGEIPSGSSIILIGANVDNGSYVDALATANAGATARYLVISGSYLV